MAPSDADKSETADSVAASIDDAGLVRTPGWWPWFTFQQPETGLRDLVVSGRRQRIQLI
jgi:hypothetical protein